MVYSRNIEKMASYIQTQTKGNLFKIEPQHPYPADYEACSHVFLTDRDENARSEITNLPESIEEYNAVLISYPILQHTALMIIGTFLENYALLELNIYPFKQSASMNADQFENSMEFVKKALREQRFIKDCLQKLTIRKKFLRI